MRIAKVLTFLLLCSALPVAASTAADADAALHDAARRGDLAAVKKLVEEGGVSVDAPTRYGATALSYAADKGHLDVVKYLVEKGADLNPKDTFYEATPILWAAFAERVEIIDFLLGKGAEGAESVLSIGVRNNNPGMVKAALAVESLDPAAVLQARQAAANLDDGAEIVALLAAVEVELPEAPEVVEVPEDVLATYVGKYRNEQIGLDIDVRVEDGTLVAQATGQPAFRLRATAAAEFEAIDVPNLGLRFAGRGGTVERAVVLQNGQELPFPRVTETAAAEPPAETAAEPDAEPVPEAEPQLAPAIRTAQQHWPSFRGPGASGIADGQGAPTRWNVETGENVLWKTPIPGLANSSPIVWGDRVFVTTAISGAGDDTFRTGLYGDVDSVEDTSKHTFRIYALDRTSGEIVWDDTVAERVPGAKRHLKSTQANSTPVTDGKRVCALFGTIGVLTCYDMKGKRLWTADTGVLDAGWFYDETYQWGHASSPILHDGLVIVQADLYRDSYIAAWNAKNGKPAWRTSRDALPSWGTPTVMEGETRDELITNGKTIRGYDAKTGEQLWTLAPNSEVTVGTPVVAHGLAFVTGGYPPVRPVYAIRPGSSGDLVADPETDESPEAVAWWHDSGGTYMPTPIVYGDLLYTCNNDGRLTAYDAKSGERVYRQRVGGGTYTASPVAADGKLYFSTEEGDVIVATAGADYRELARNEMGEVIMATPAISGGTMIVRTQDHVWGLAEPAPEGSDGESAE